MEAATAWVWRERLEVDVLDADPELGTAVPDAVRPAARRWATARVEIIYPGPFDPARQTQLAPGDLGLLVLDGVLLREVDVGGRRSLEVLGPGDLLRPADGEEGDGALVPHEVSWCVLHDVRVAVLDRRFAALAGRCPELGAALMDRTVRRARRQGILHAIAQLPGLEVRLQAALWHLADRFGRVVPDGVVVPLRLTHETLAHLVGAQRPSVTTVLSRLQREGTLARNGAGGWLLRAEPPFAA